MARPKRKLTTLPFLFLLATLITPQNAQDGMTCPATEPRFVDLEDEVDVTIGAVLKLHDPGQGVFGCGAPSPEGVQYYEALRWAVQALNKQDGSVAELQVSESFVPGVKFGLRIYDSCGHSEMAIRQMTELFPVMKSGSLSCDAIHENSSSIIGMLDMSSSLRDPRVAETVSRYIIPVIPLRQETAVPPEQLGKVLAEVVHDMNWERVAILHAEDEYSIFVTKVFTQIAKSGYPCISAIKSFPRQVGDLDARSYHKMLSSFASKLTDKTGIVVIGHNDVFEIIIKAFVESPDAFSRLQWLFSWMPPFAKLQSLGSMMHGKQIFSLAPFPKEIVAFEDYWARLGDVSSIYDPRDRVFLEHVMAEKNCRILGFGHPAYDNLVVCENLVLKRDATDVLMRTARFLPAVHSLYTFAQAYRKAWTEKCLQVPGMCPSLSQMSRREFVERYLEPLEFQHSSQDRSPPEVQGQKTNQGASGEMEGTQLAVNVYSFSSTNGLQFKQILAYDSQESKVLDAAFRYVPSVCPKGGCKDCIRARQSRLEDPYIGMSSSENIVSMAPVDEIMIPVLLPIHKAGQGPLDCSDEINMEAVQDLEAALWTIDQINRDTEFLPGIRLGAVAIDTCSSSVQIMQKLSNFLMDAKSKGIDDISSDLAFVMTGTRDELMAASSIIAPLNSTLLSISDAIRPMDISNHHLQIAVPFERKMKAIIETLKYLGWNYVTVVHDQDDRSQLMSESFTTLARESDICLGADLSPSGMGDIEMDSLMINVVEAKKKGARAVVMWTSEKVTQAFLKAVHRAVLAGVITTGDIVIISSGDWVVNLQSFKDFENEATGVIVLKIQQGEVENFVTYFQRLRPETNKRNPWFHQLWEQRRECEKDGCESGTNTSPIGYTPSASSVNVIQGLLAISAGLARLRNELCHPDPGLCPKMLQTPELRQQLFRYIRETASSRLDAKGEMFAFTKQGYGNLPIEIFNFRRAAGSNFVYQKVGIYQNHLSNLADIVMYNSEGKEISLDKMTSECISECDTCDRRPMDFVILDSKDQLYLATSVDVHQSSPNPLTCGPSVTSSGLQTLEAFLWALDQINSSPQLLPGVTLGAVVFDTCNSKEKAARDIANFFSSSLSSPSMTHKVPGVSQILGLLAAQSDDTIQPVIDVSMAFNMMTFAPRVTSTKFNDLVKYPTLLRSSLPNDVRAGALIDLLKHFKWSYVSVLYSDNEYGETDLLRSFKLKAEDRGIGLALVEKIPIEFSSSAMNVVLEKLKSKQQEGARAVMLLLNSNHTSMLLSSVKSEQESGRFKLGDFVWVTFGNLDSFHSYPLVSLGAIMVQPSYSTVYPFKQHFESLNPRNNSRDPWFREYWEQIFKCRGVNCNEELQTLAEISFLQDSQVSKVINSVLSVGVGLESLRKELCPGTSHGLCKSMIDTPQLREMLFNFTRDTSFMGAEGKLFKFTGQQFSAGVLDVLNFRQVGSNAHAFVKVGQYSPDEGLALNFSRLKLYDEMGKEINLYDIKSECESCNDETIHTDMSVMQIIPKQEFAISISMPIHDKGKNFFTCGELRDTVMFHQLVGIAYALEDINQNSNVEIGAIIFDYCSRTQKAEEQMYSYFSKQHDHEASNIKIKPKSVIAAITYGEQVSRESAPILESVDVMQVATPAGKLESYKENDILHTTPSTMSQIQGLLSILKKFKWLYVNVVYSNTDFGRSGYYEFSKGAKERGVCLANVVLVEPDGDRDSILTILQNGLSRDATVVVTLIDDQKIIQKLIEAVKISFVLNKYTWLGTDAWSGDPMILESFQDATFDAITMRMETHEMPEFRKFYERLTLWNHHPIPDSWFEEFWQHRFQCQLPNSQVTQKKYASVCTGKEKLTADEILETEHVYQTIETIESIAEGLQSYLSKKCPYGMAATSIDDCGSEARQELHDEIQIILRGTEGECEECGSTGTIFGYEVLQHIMAENGTNLHIQIGNWKDGLLFVDDSKVSFSTYTIPKSLCKEDCDACLQQLGTTEPLHSSPEPFYANFQTVWGIIVTALSVLGMVLVIICALYFLMSFPVTVGTTVLGYMILFGLLLLYAVNFAFILSPTEGTCGIRRFGLGLAYAVIFSGMLVKVMNTWRLMGYNGSRILSDGTRLSSPAGLLVIAVGLVIIQIVLSAAWLILMPPKTGTYEHVWRCAPPTTFEEGLVVSLIYVMLLLAITTLFALLTWQCQDNNRESRWILACAILVAVVWLAWTILSTQLSPHYRDTTIAAANLLNATIIMMCLYMRKVYLYSKLTRQARDQDLKTHLQPTSTGYSHSLYGSSQKTFSTLAPVLYGSQASLNAKKLYNGPSSRVELINCPEDNKSDSSGSVQVQATDLYPLDMYDGGSQFQPVSSLYGSNHTLVLDDTLTFSR